MEQQGQRNRVSGQPSAGLNPPDSLYQLSVVFGIMYIDSTPGQRSM